MSDPNGNHPCHYAERDEVSWHLILCTKSGKVQTCGGIIEECEIDYEAEEEEDGKEV